MYAWCVCEIWHRSSAHNFIDQMWVPFKWVGRNLFLPYNVEDFSSYFLHFSSTFDKIWYKRFLLSLLSNYPWNSAQWKPCFKQGRKWIFTRISRHYCLFCFTVRNYTKLHSVFLNFVVIGAGQAVLCYEHKNKIMFACVQWNHVTLLK
jgi:hypothetical protein